MRTSDWGEIGRAVGKVRLARGYRLELLRRREIPVLVCKLKSWFPEITVGSASCYLDEQFLAGEVYFPGGPDKDVLVVLVKKDDEIAGLFSCQRDRNTLALYAHLGVIAPEHRGRRVANSFPVLAEAIARSAGMGMTYGMATLKVPYVQRVFERRGWHLVGIAPGYDRELIAPGVVKRVYEAIYAKVLVARTALLRPSTRNLTERTRAFFRVVFPRRLSG